MILLDTSGVFAAYDRASRLNDAVRVVLESEQDVPILSPFVLAELDYLVTKRLGHRTELDFLDEVGRGVYELADFATDDVVAARTVLTRYEDLDVGLTDASIVVLAERYHTNRVLTLDERHFRVLKLKRGKPFVVLPADG